MKKLLYLFTLFMYPLVISALELTYLGVTFRYEIISGDDIRIIGIDENSSAFSDTNYTNLIFPANSNNLNIKEIGLTPTGFDVGNLPSRITNITLEDGIEKILDVCFINYTQIETFSLPESILSMGREAFTSCTSITDFTIPSSVSKIDRRLFENCTSLRHIHIPNSVTRIESDAFNYCIKLQEIELPSNLTTLRSSAFMDCQSLKKVIIPNGITRIEEELFYRCDSLKSVVLPFGVNEIEDYAFEGCPQLTNITIPSNINYFGYDLFTDYSQIKSLTIAEGSNSMSADSKSFIQSLKADTIEYPSSFTQINSSDYDQLATSSSGIKALVINGNTVFNVTSNYCISTIILNKTETTCPEIKGSDLTLNNGLTLAFTINNNSKWHHLCLPFACNNWTIKTQDGIYDVTNDIQTYWRYQTFNSSYYASCTNIATANGWETMTTRPSTIQANSPFALLNRLKTTPLIFRFHSSAPFTVSEPNNNSLFTKYENPNGDIALQDWNFIGFNSFQSVGNNQSISVISCQGYLDGIDPIIVSECGNAYSQCCISQMLIKPTQAFFMQPGHLSGNSGIISIGPGGAPLLPNIQSSNEIYTYIRIGVKDENNNKDQTTIILNDTFTSEYDLGADMIKWKGNNDTLPRISIQGGKYDLCYAAYPHRISNFPLNLFAIKNKSYTIELNDTTNSSHISSILLIDHDTNISTNILKHTYSFIANSTSTSNRFELVINPKDQTTHIIPNKNQESIHSLNNHIFFTNCRGKYIIYNNKGQIMEKGNIKNSIYQSKAMTKGIYIVDHNNKVYKIILL